MALRTNRITVRGVDYLVQEPSGRDQQALRKALAMDSYKHKVEAYTAHLCLLEPKWTEEQALDQPQAVLTAIANEAMRLRDEEDEAPKAPTTA